MHITPVGVLSSLSISTLSLCHKILMIVIFTNVTVFTIHIIISILAKKGIPEVTDFRSGNFGMFKFSRISDIGTFHKV